MREGASLRQPVHLARGAEDGPARGRFRRDRIAATDLNSKATWFGSLIKPVSTFFALNFN
jgi:hypothetical protein